MQKHECNCYDILHKIYQYFCKSQPKNLQIPLIGGSRLRAIIVGGYLMKELYEQLSQFGHFVFEMVFQFFWMFSMYQIFHSALDRKQGK